MRLLESDNYVALVLALRPRSRIATESFIYMTLAQNFVSL